MSNTESIARTWLNGESTNQGYPILFRRPNVKVSEYPTLAKQYPVLLIGTLQLAEFKANGLPEAIYNKSLASLDDAIISPFRSDENGQVGLVETFAAKRTYYVYVTSIFNVDGFTSLLETTFPKANMKWKRRDDPTWRLLNGYASDFGFA